VVDTEILKILKALPKNQTRYLQIKPTSCKGLMFLKSVKFLVLLSDHNVEMGLNAQY